MRGAAALLVLSSLAWAQSPEQLSRARTHFEAGRALYNLGNYTDAIREFSAGYSLVPKPQFLVNLGQAYRKAGNLPRAKEMFQKFLRDAPANDPDRKQVRGILDEIDDQILDEPVPRPVPPPAPPPGGSSQPPAPLVVAAPAPPVARKSFMARHWWIVPVSAVVVAGVSVGVYFALKPPDPVSCEGASLGCIDAPPR